MAVRFLLSLPTDHVEHHEAFGTAAAVSEMSRLAEDAGYDAVFVTDHPIPTASFVETGGHHALEPTVVLAVAAAATTRLQLMTNLYLVGYRNPFLAAKAVASLDSLSEGRVILGTGAGFLEPEFRALGVDFARRNEILDENLSVMKRVWEGEPVTLEGEGWAASKQLALPRPISRPHPPIWIGGNSPRALRRVVEHGQGWIPLQGTKRPPSYLRSPELQGNAALHERIDGLRQHAAEIGRTEPIDVIAAPRGVRPFGHPEFDAGALAAAIDEVAALGVTHVPVKFATPAMGLLQKRSDFLSRAEDFASQVIDRVRAGA
jgi:probable F420-dependent oxidoreductase